MKLTPEELQDKAIQALSSGTYTKTEDFLKREEDTKECFCVLGVLADVYIKNDDENTFEWRLNTDNLKPYYSVVKTETNEIYARGHWLPEEIYQAYGLRGSLGGLGDIPEPIFEEMGEYSSLTQLNDSKIFSFEELAELMEVHRNQIFPGSIIR